MNTLTPILLSLLLLPGPLAGPRWHPGEDGSWVRGPFTVARDPADRWNWHVYRRGPLGVERRPDGWERPESAMIEADRYGYLLRRQQQLGCNCSPTLLANGCCCDGEVEVEGPGPGGRTIRLKFDTGRCECDPWTRAVIGGRAWPKP